MEGTMKKTASVSVCFFAITVMFCLQAISADKQQICTNYADTAVQQYNFGQQHNLPGIVPPVWSNDRNGHYNWCMHGENYRFANNENAKRQAYLDKKIIKAPPKQQSGSSGAVMGTGIILPDIVRTSVSTAGDNSYLGCFRDRKDRDLSGYTFNSPQMTKKLCMETCRKKGFGYAGLQYSRYCFCGNSYGRLGKADNCNMACAGNSKETCGGGWANSVYKVTTGNNNGNFAKMAPMPTAGTGQINVLKNIANKLRVHGPINLSVAQQYLNKRAVSKSKDKELLSPYESPMFDLEVGGSVSQTVELGRGYNSLLGQARFPALEAIPPADIRTLWAFNSHANGHYVRNSEEYYDALGIAVDVSGSFMGFSASSSTRYEESNANSKFTETYAAYADIDTFLKYPTLTDLKLNNNARTLLKQKGVAEFYRQYGDSFIYAIQYGAGFKGTMSYDVVKKEEQYKFSQAVFSGGWGVEAKVGYERSSAEKMEHVEAHGAFHNYGAVSTTIPQSVQELKSVATKFQQLAYDFASHSNDQDAYGGIVRYTLIKYSNLPEFMQLAGGVDKLNLTEAKMLLSQLTYYKRKIKRMKNNLLFVIDSKNRSKFSDQDRSRSAQLLQQKIDPQLVSIKYDIARLQGDPFNHNLLGTIAGNVQTYKKVSGFAPSSEFVKVTVDFPISPRDKKPPNQTLWNAQVGPLIGWPHVGGDDQVASSGKIDVNINSELEISPDKNNIYLYQKFHLRENKPDYTTISGSKRLKVYTAPEGYRIVGLKQKRADYYHMRNMRGNGYIPMKDVLSRDNGAPPAKADDLWEELQVIFDNGGAQDSKYVGLYGKMRLFVELEELAPKE